MTAKPLPDTLARDFEAKLGESLTQLYAIWDDIGIVDEQRAERVNVVFYHLHDLLREMLEEEKNMRNKMLARIDAYGEELLKLTSELKVEKYTPPEGLTTLQLEKELRMQVENLNKIKQERLKRMKKLKGVEQQLCDNLCMTPYYIQSGSVPTEEQLKELNQHIAMLTQEQTKRRSVYAERKKAITALEKELERSAAMEKERRFENETSFVLSADNLNKLAAIQKQLEEEHKTNFDLAGELRDRLEILWNRLEVEDEERRSFNSEHTGFKPSVIKALQKKIASCELLKIKYLEKFVAGAREELAVWWDKCFIPQAERDLFFLFKQEELSESLLDAHDQEVQKISSYYKENSALFQKLAKRQDMFEHYMDLESKANDPNRFNNRGGQLLLEEKRKRKLLKDLPKLEAELADDIVAWENEKGRDLLLAGMKFPEYIENQWENFKNQKENEKMERQRKQAKVMEEEMMYGSKPVTPAKKRFTSTPSKTPNKFRKIITPGMNSTSRAPGSSTLSRTQMSSQTATLTGPSPLAAPPQRALSKPPQKQTPRRLRDTAERRKSFQRKILSEKNALTQEKQPSQAAQQDKSFSQTIITRSAMADKTRTDAAGIAPPGTEFTYREFVQGITTDARSSILVIPPGAQDVQV